MSSFPTNVPGPTRISNRPNISINEAQFGDGYSQRAVHGLNNIKNIFNLNWDLLSSSEATIILDYLSGKNGATKFDWVDPDSISYQVICKEWSYNRTNERYSIQAKFDEVFDL